MTFAAITQQSALWAKSTSRERAMGRAFFSISIPTSPSNAASSCTEVNFASFLARALSWKTSGCWQMHRSR